MIAFGIKAALEQHGFSVVGPFHNVEGARDASVHQDFDVALLDINLGGDTTSASIADGLLDLNIPFMFISGYGSAKKLPDRFSKITRMTKPVHDQDLIAGLAELAAHKAA